MKSRTFTEGDIQTVNEEDTWTVKETPGVRIPTNSIIDYRPGVYIEQVTISM